MAAEFVGAGWAFPLRLDSTGRVALVTADREIEEAIRLVLGTAPGERPMRPEFGSRISELVFAPADATTAGQLAFESRVALERWEPRIDVEDVEVTFDSREEGKLYIDVRYSLRGTNDPRNLVFPFYLIPEHEGSAPSSVPAQEPPAVEGA
jgi:phage baseplate assembly protein W